MGQGWQKGGGGGRGRRTTASGICGLQSGCYWWLAGTEWQLAVNRLKLAVGPTRSVVILDGQGVWTGGENQEK